MKKYLVLIGVVSCSFTAAAQSIAGNWEGFLNIQGTQLPVIFHISDSAGKFSATFDSPSQMAYNLSCSGVILHGDSLVLQMKMMGGRYESLLSADKRAAKGTWFQGAGSLPLDLKKTSDVVTKAGLKRPQTPKAPFPYLSEDIVYFNADKSIQLGATFTWPSNKDAKKYPAVLLVTGSSQQDRDETIFEHKAFAVIADYLTRQGIAVLRVDDRGIGKSTGNFATATTADFANDAGASLDYLKSRKEVDITNIGVIGHSEGGLIAPMLAAKRNDIRFIVLLAGPGAPIMEMMQQQNNDVLAAAGVSKPDIDAYAPLYKDLVMNFLKENDSATALKNAADIFNNWQKNTAPAVVANTTGVRDEKSKEAFIDVFAKQMRAPWFNYFMKQDPAENLGKIHCALLALNGERDVQVAAGPNLEAIRKTMVANKIKNFNVQALPGLNHLFQHCKTCSTDEYAQLEESFAPEALSIMGNWIKETVSK